MTLVKICGITNLEDALLSAKLGADVLGFNFYEKSPRYVTSHVAKDIAVQLPQNVKKVGVFVNEQAYRIGEIVDLIGLDAVQLHGDEDLKFVKDLRSETKAEIIKAFRVSPDFRPEHVADHELDGVLLDAYSSEKYGGTGESFDWHVAIEVKSIVPKLYLAGGLTPDNVSNAVAKVQPYAVDVASGVEWAKGRKDAVKLEAFIRNAKNA